MKWQLTGCPDEVDRYRSVQQDLMEESIVRRWGYIGETGAMTEVLKMMGTTAWQGLRSILTFHLRNVFVFL